MTHIVLTLSNYLQSPIEGLINVLKNVYKSIENGRMQRAIQIVKQQMMSHRTYRQTYNELSALTDKELNDIGLSRGDIHSVAMEAYYDGIVERNPNLKGWV